MDLLMVNLVMMATYRPRSEDPSGILRSRVARVPTCRSRPITPWSAPMRFAHAATGVHAAAVMKAFRANRDRALMDAVYAAVPASRQGASRDRGRTPLRPLERRLRLEPPQSSRDRRNGRTIFAAAKASSRTLAHDQILELIQRAGSLTDDRHERDTKGQEVMKPAPCLRGSKHSLV